MPGIVLESSHSTKLQSECNLQALLKRAKANSQAQLGQYDPSTESSEAGERTYEKGYVY